MVKTLQLKLRQGQHIVTDGRGKHANHHSQPLAVVQRIEAHLQTFPQYEVHYSRAKLNQFYLSSDLTLDRMFSLFVTSNPNLLEAERKENIYRKTFRDSGLKIGEPRTDTCKVCDTMNINLRSARRDNIQVRINAAILERDAHLQMVEVAHATLRADLQRSLVDLQYVVLCADLQQVR
jgi:hypothetical protein